MKVLVIEPIRYCVSPGSAATSPYAPTPGELAVADDAGDERRQVSGDLPLGQEPLEPVGGGVRDGAHRTSSVDSANASGGGQEQTRWRSPYAWSMRATGGQYLSGSGPVGNAATSRG